VQGKKKRGFARESRERVEIFTGGTKGERAARRLLFYISNESGLMAQAAGGSRWRCEVQSGCALPLCAGRGTLFGDAPYVWMTISKEFLKG